jgi:hypothetical protein
MTANSKIAEDIKTFLDANENCNKKDFVAACGAAFNEHKGKGKKAAKEVESEEEVEEKPKAKPVKEAKEKPVKAAKKPTKKEAKEAAKKDKEEKPKKELNGYQKFVKEHMPTLKARENAKDDGEEKKKASDLMKEIGEMWQAEKEAKKEKEDE